MTILVGCVAIIMVAVLGIGIGSVGRASALDTRAQLAADAAALAAVAESAPGGSGHPEEQARLYADLNGAEIVECICIPGASAMQVRVAVEGATATARAVFDPGLLAPVVPEGGFRR